MSNFCTKINSSSNSNFTPTAFNAHVCMEQSYLPSRQQRYQDLMIHTHTPRDSWYLASFIHCDAVWRLKTLSLSLLHKSPSQNHKLWPTDGPGFISLGLFCLWKKQSSNSTSGFQSLFFIIKAPSSSTSKIHIDMPRRKAGRVWGLFMMYHEISTNAPFPLARLCTLPQGTGHPLVVKAYSTQ